MLEKASWLSRIIAGQDMQRNQVWPTFVIFQTLRRRDTQTRQSFKWQVERSENNVWKAVHVRIWKWKSVQLKTEYAHCTQIQKDDPKFCLKLLVNPPKRIFSYSFFAIRIAEFEPSILQFVLVCSIILHFLNFFSPTSTSASIWAIVTLLEKGVCSPLWCKSWSWPLCWPVMNHWNCCQITEN